MFLTGVPSDRNLAITDVQEQLQRSSPNGSNEIMTSSPREHSSCLEKLIENPENVDDEHLINQNHTKGLKRPTDEYETRVHLEFHSKFKNKNNYIKKEYVNLKSETRLTALDTDQINVCEKNSENKDFLSSQPSTNNLIKSRLNQTLADSLMSHCYRKHNEALQNYIEDNISLQVMSGKNVNVNSEHNVHSSTIKHHHPIHLNQSPVLQKQHVEIASDPHEYATNSCTSVQSHHASKDAFTLADVHSAEGRGQDFLLGREYTGRMYKFASENFPVSITTPKIVETNRITYPVESTNVEINRLTDPADSNDSIFFKSKVDRLQEDQIYGDLNQPISVVKLDTLRYAEQSEKTASLNPEIAHERQRSSHSLPKFLEVSYKNSVSERLIRDEGLKGYTSEILTRPMPDYHPTNDSGLGIRQKVENFENAPFAHPGFPCGAFLHTINSNLMKTNSDCFYGNIFPLVNETEQALPQKCITNKFDYETLNSRSQCILNMRQNIFEHPISHASSARDVFLINDTPQLQVERNHKNQYKQLLNTSQKFHDAQRQEFLMETEVLQNQTHEHNPAFQKSLFDDFNCDVGNEYRHNQQDPRSVKPKTKNKPIIGKNF